MKRTLCDFLPAALGTVLVPLVVGALAAPASAQLIEAGVNATPSVLLLFDTSGSMEWLAEDDTYPRCLVDPAEYPLLTHGCTSTVDCQDGLFCNTTSGSCEFIRPRSHAALEALTGTIQNYFPRCDDRTADPTRIDQLATSPPQGIRHSIACSWSAGATLAEMCYRQPSGTLVDGLGRPVPPPDFRQRPDGLLDLYRDLLTFGFMAFDSFRSPNTGTEGMYSYGVRGYSPSPGSDPGTCANDTLCWNLGARRPGVGFEGASIAPVDPSDDTQARRAQINEEVQLSLLSTVSYWSTPISAMLEDALTFYTGGESGQYYSWYREQDPTGTDNGAFDYAYGLTDLYGDCRRRYVVLITDGVPSFAECERRGTITTNDPWLPGCDGYWYKDAEYYARALLAEGIETYVIGYNIIDQFDPTDPRSARARLQRIADEGSLLPNPVRYADSSRELIFELGDILAQLAAATTSRSRPATYNVLSATEQGQFEVNARFIIDRASRYWGGDLVQSARVCQGPSLVDRAEDISAAALLNARAPDQRTIFTSSPRIHSCSLAALDGIGNLFNSASLGGATGQLTALSNRAVEDACGISGQLSVLRLLACRDLLNGAVGPLVADFPFISTRPESCLVDFNLALAQSNSSLVRASSPGEARFFARWLRGETLTEIRLNTVEPDSFDYPAILDNYLPANLSFVAAENRYLRDRLSSLADIFHSAPAISVPPVLGPNSSPSYRDFAESTQLPGDVPRRTMAYVGTNDGLLHAFDARTMEEVWAFLPPSFISRIAEWIEPGHTFMFDGTPVVQDVVVDRRLDGTGNVAADWRTILVSGYRGGGRGYMAMDVSQPDEPSFLWELDSELDPLLGLTYAEPGLGVVRYAPGRCPRATSDACERGVAILTGGVAPPGTLPSDPIGRVVYVVDLETGRVIRRFTDAITAANPISGEPFRAALGGSIAVYNGADGSLVSRAYFGDAEGRLYRLDVSDGNPQRWRVDLFFDPYNHPRFDGTQRYGQIVFRPTVSLGTDRRAIVVFGMGNVDELDDLGPQRNYVLSLTEKPIFAGETVVRFEGFINWAIELEPYEKLTARPRIFDRRAYFATFLPDDADLCEIGGARLYGVAYDGNRQRVDSTGNYGTEGPVLLGSQMTALRPDLLFLPPSSDIDDSGNLASTEDPVAFWDATSGSFIPPKTIIFSLAVGQPPVCVPLDSDDDLFTQQNITAPAVDGEQQGSAQLSVGMSSFETDAAGAPGAVGSTRSFNLPIREFSRAYTTSWSIVLE